MIWDVPHTLAFLSQFYELLPGDLVFTGTPAGVGAVVAGDRLDGGIAGLEPLAIAIVPRGRLDAADGRSSRARLQQPRGGSGPPAVVRAVRASCRRQARAALAPMRDLRYGPGRRRRSTSSLPAGTARGDVRVHPRRLLARARQERLLVRRAGRSSPQGSPSRCSTTTSAQRCPSRPSSTSAGAPCVARPRRRRARRRAPTHRRRRPFGRRASGGDDAGDRLGGDGLARDPSSAALSLSGVHDLAPMVQFSYQRRPAARRGRGAARCRRHARAASAGAAARRRRRRRDLRVHPPDAVMWDAWPANRPPADGPLCCRPASLQRGARLRRPGSELTRRRWRCSSR